MLLLFPGKTGKDVLGPGINAVERGIIVETLACDFVVDGTPYHCQDAFQFGHGHRYYLTP
jgi:hypothetical protein